MEPQTPQPVPINNPGVVTGGPIVAPPETPNPSGGPVISPTGKSSKKWLLWLIVVVVIAGGAGGAFAYKKHHDDQKKQVTQQNQQQVQQVATTPNYGNIKVGDFRYVNACQALPAADESKLFAGLARVALVTAKYAENSLPAKDIPSDGVSSTCSRGFGSDTPYADTTLTFEVKQFATTASAKKLYDALGVTQSDVDKNGSFGTKLTTNTAPLAGAANTLYEAVSNTSYTLVDNKILSFSASLGTVTADQFKQAIVAALPTVTTHAKDQSLKQDLNKDDDFGKAIGTSTFMNTCEFFTAGDFHSMTGTYNNPTAVEFAYNYDSPQTFFTDNSSGDANDACTRISYPSGNQTQLTRVEIEYFKSADEASQAVQAHMTKILSDAGLSEKVAPVSGVGSYAAYITPTNTSPVSYFYVQKGSYALKLHTDLLAGYGSKKYPTADEYGKAANVLLSKLK